MTGTGPAVLDRDRLEAMKANVMTAIADHERSESARRGRRRNRLVAGGVVAAAAVVIAGIGLGNGLSGTSGSDDSMAGGSEVANVEARGGIATGSSADTAQDEPPASTPDAPVARSVITTGSMSVAVDDVDDAVGELHVFARTQGGRIDGESFDEGTAPFADLTVRIPAEQIDALRRRLAGLGTVQSVQIERSDVSARVADVEARIESLESSIRRLRSIVAEAGTTKDLLDAEAQMTQRQADLEGLQAQQRVLANQTSLATIDVSLSPTQKAQSVEPSGFFGGLTRGWNALVDTTNAAVTGAGVLVPWLLPVGALAALMLGVRRRR